MNILATFTPDIEVYSIDEAFLEFKGFENYNLHDYSVEIKDKIKKWTSMPVSIGLAPTKALSKIANRIAKKYTTKTNGVYFLDTDEKITKALKWTKISDVWGIGRKISKKLQAINVFTAYDFIQLSDSFIRKEFSVVGLRLKHELQGVSILKLEKVQTKKAIATTRSFKHDISNLDNLKERVATFAINCAKKLRNQKSNANILMVFIHTNEYKSTKYRKSITIKLPFATNSSITISKYAIKALELLYKKGYCFKKAGVIVMGITPINIKQLNLFANENPKHKKLMAVMDKINGSYGEDILKLANQNLEKTWIMRQEKLSKQYTTNWNELLTVS